MNDGALLVLVGQGIQNRAFTHANISKSYKSLPLYRDANKYKIDVPRYADSFSIRGLTIHRATDDTAVNIKSIKLIIGNQTILNIPYSVLCAIGKVRTDNRVTTISCDFAVFMREVHQVRIQYNVIRIEVDVENCDNIQQIEVPIECVYYDTEQRRELVTMASIDTPIQFIETQEIRCAQQENSPEPYNRRKFSKRLAFTNVSKGLLIEGPTRSIKSVSFDFIRDQTTHNYFKYDEAMIRYIGHELSPNMLYIPFNTNAELLSPLPQTFQAGVNFSRFDNITLTIDTHDPYDSIKVHSVASNIFRSQQGLCTLLYSTIYADNSSNNPIALTFSRTQVWDIEYKVITDDKTFCPILHDDIKTGTTYAHCTKCKNNFDFESLSSFFNASRQQRCPICREGWINCKKYINAERADVETESLRQPSEVVASEQTASAAE